MSKDNTYVSQSIKLLESKTETDKERVNWELILMHSIKSKHHIELNPQDFTGEILQSQINNIIRAAKEVIKRNDK